ncbi:uncharacterized protein V6R79_010220 [Siganus canaliculatus]
MYMITYMFYYCIQKRACGLKVCSGQFGLRASGSLRQSARQADHIPPLNPIFSRMTQLGYPGGRAAASYELREAAGHELLQATRCSKLRAAAGHKPLQATSCSKLREASSYELLQATCCCRPRAAAA